MLVYPYASGILTVCFLVTASGCNSIDGLSAATAGFGNCKQRVTSDERRLNFSPQTRMFALIMRGMFFEKETFWINNYQLLKLVRSICLP
jgi:hypothetical protein